MFQTLSIIFLRGFNMSINIQEYENNLNIYNQQITAKKNEIAISYAREILTKSGMEKEIVEENKEKRKILILVVLIILVVIAIGSILILKKIEKRFQSQKKKYNFASSFSRKTTKYVIKTINIISLV